MIRLLSNTHWVRLILIGILFWFFCAAFFGCDGSSSKGKNSPTDPWILTWNDEFNGNTLDHTKWESVTRIRRPNVSGPDGYWSSDDVILDGIGHLVIRARQIANRNGDADPYDYSCGMIRSKGKFEQRFGKFEIRCKLPAKQGWWVAFWLLCQGIDNVDTSGEDGTEIDIFEGFGWTNRLQHALHWDGYGGEAQKSVKSMNFPGIREGYHIFTLEWFTDKYIFYIDGKETWRTSDGGVSKVPEYLKITGEISTEDWAISNYWAQDPQGVITMDENDEFLIDYVRVYQLRSN